MRQVIPPLQDARQEPPQVSQLVGHESVGMPHLPLERVSSPVSTPIVFWISRSKSSNKSAIRINVEFAEEMDKRHARLSLPRFEAYSYPMRYAPLTARDRSFVGDNWTAQTLKNVRLMLHVTKGVVYSRRPYFETVWGGTVGEFYARLAMQGNKVEGFAKGKLKAL